MMELRVTPIDRLWSPGIRIFKNEVDSELRDNLHSKFVKFLVESMTADLKRAIKTQRYKRIWVPLNEHYLQSKIKKGLSPNIWEATGLLVNSITYYKRGLVWTVGISNSKYYPGTSIKVMDVARWIEYGTSRTPARPLFTPLFEYYQKNIRFYWNKFLIREGRI